MHEDRTSHAGADGGSSRSSAISRKISWNICRGIATSAISNTMYDGNSAWSRRYFDLQAGHISDLGGRDVLSEAQLSLVARASAIECEIERMTGALSRGEQVDLDVFTRTCSHLRRILETLGIERKPRGGVSSAARSLPVPR